MPTTDFLASLSKPDDASANKTRVVHELMDTKNLPPEQVRLLGVRKDGRSSYYYFAVPGAIIEIEIYWKPDEREYHRAFSDVFDDPREVARMLGTPHHGSSARR